MSAIQEKPFKTKPKIPERSLAQRREALDNANRIRTLRAQLKRELKTGKKSIIDIFLEPPEWVRTMKVFEAVLACPKYGKARSRQVLSSCRISYVTTIGGMSKRQRTEIVAVMMRR